ncbi:MAG: helix-turn-helix transcriptional regulator [Acidobacteriota bacterium]
MSNETLPPEVLKARLIRALSGLSQAQMGERVGIDPGHLAHMEMGEAPVTEDQLRRMAAEAGISIAEADELLGLYQEQTRPWLRTGEGMEAILDEIGRGLRQHAGLALQRLLKLPPPPQDDHDTEEQLANLRRLSPRSRLAVVRSVEGYRTPALARRCREEARRCREKAAADPRRAAAWERLADEIGGQGGNACVPGGM